MLGKTLNFKPLHRFKDFNFFVLLLDNIALRRPTYQDTRYHGHPNSLTQASNGVDGLKSNLSEFGGQCVFSEERQQTATWWVNLTSILSIQQVTIYFRAWGMSIIVSWVFF